jgi:tetratricopeptide (TPR) repeat protein
MNEENRYTLKEAHLKFAKMTNGQVWNLLERSDRSPDEDEDMLLAAMTSFYHWKQVGSAVNDQRGRWILSRVYTSLGRAQDAVEQAEMCFEITESYQDEMEDFDLAFAQEGLARAYAMAGDLNKAKEHQQLAIKLGEEIKDPEDRKIFMDDLQSGNWFGLK